MASNYYEILGLPRNASAEEVRHAWEAKSLLFDPARYPQAPEEVVLALSETAMVVDDAWRVLGDPGRRADYDRELQAQGFDADEQRSRAEHIWAMERALGLPLSPVFGIAPPSHQSPPAHSAGPGRRGSLDESGQTKARGHELLSYFSGLEALASWLAPRPRPEQTVTVPDLQGLSTKEAFYEAALADLHLNFVRVASGVPEGPGVVISQTPAAGSEARRHSTLTVHALYEESPRPRL